MWFLSTEYVLKGSVEVFFTQTESAYARMRLSASTRLVQNNFQTTLATDCPVPIRMFLYNSDNYKNVNIYYNKEESLFISKLFWLFLQT